MTEPTQPRREAAWTWTVRDPFDGSLITEFPLSPAHAELLIEAGCSVVSIVWPAYTQAAVQVPPARSAELARMLDALRA
jgi:hypothetical protein